jgi:asparagine synthase (glutamine-hydrolysing)
VKVVLAGYASDGLFGGMPKHKIVKLMQLFPWMRGPLEEFYHYTQTSLNPHSQLGRKLKQAYYKGGDAPPPKVLKATSIPSLDPLPTSEPELLNQVLRSGTLVSLPKWLPKADRLHLAHGLRFRSPYTDKNFIERAFQVPSKFKIYRWREKHIFREAIKPLLPEEILNQPKIPQAMKYDLSFSRILEELAAQYLSRSRIRERGIFDEGEITNLLERTAGKPYSSERAMRIWTAVLTEIWAEQFLDRHGQPVEEFQPFVSLE